MEPQTNIRYKGFKNLLAKDIEGAGQEKNIFPWLTPSVLSLLIKLYKGYIKKVNLFLLHAPILSLLPFNYKKLYLKGVAYDI